MGAVMNELTVHTGLAGDVFHITVDWFDENLSTHQNELSIKVLDIDKPRTIAIVLDDKVLANITKRGVTFA